MSAIFTVRDLGFGAWDPGRYFQIAEQFENDLNSTAQLCRGGGAAWGVSNAHQKTNSFRRDIF